MVASTTSLKELLDSLRTEQLIPSDSHQAIATYALEHQKKEQDNLSTMITAGVGAFFLSLCLCGFLGFWTILAFNNKGGHAFIGALLIISAIIFHRFTATISKAFHRQMFVHLSFYKMVMGKLLVVWGMAQFFKSDGMWACSTILLLLSVATYHLYAMSADRFLSVFLTFISFLITIVLDRDAAWCRPVLFNLFLVGQVVLISFLFFCTELRRTYIPLAYATVLSLCASVLYVVLPLPTFFAEFRVDYLTNVFCSSLLTLFLIAVLASVSNSVKKLANEPLSIATFGAIFIGLVVSPGVVLALSLMILGYARYERKLFLIGAFFMPVFLTFYYYNLDSSLLTKSGILIFSGVLLLVGRLYLSIKKIDRQELV